MRVGRDALTKVPNLKFVETVGDTVWELYSYTSSQCLLGENPSNCRFPLRYDVICRRSGARVALVARGAAIVEHILANGLADVRWPGLHRVPIAITELVRCVVQGDSRYALSSVYAKASEYGESLRAVSLYGDSIDTASLFRENLSSLEVNKCGLKAADGGTEIAKVGKDGALSFRYVGEKRLFEVEGVLTFLRASGYLAAPRTGRAKGQAAHTAPRPVAAKTR